MARELLAAPVDIGFPRLGGKQASDAERRESLPFPQRPPATVDSLQALITRLVRVLFYPRSRSLPLPPPFTSTAEELEQPPSSR